ncbi:hypothetical protein AAFF_G00206870 [Aldrovandia affinis]|uniref:Uncharacterized protein n=1 Tax=Aldrovandia affinis TaxID=143900 RepID=A0AAD7R006_9TELE|nr:hypothetical protein AAFF_G00206870 [Aldrovandia affinis]
MMMRTGKAWGQNVTYGEKDGTIYSYAYFHFIFFLGSLRYDDGHQLVPVKRENLQDYDNAKIERLLAGSWSGVLVKDGVLLGVSPPLHVDPGGPHGLPKEI